MTFFFFFITKLSVHEFFQRKAGLMSAKRPKSDTIARYVLYPHNSGRGWHVTASRHVLPLASRLRRFLVESV